MVNPANSANHDDRVERVERVEHVERDNVRLASGANILVAIWLFASPWVLIYDGNAGWNSTIVAVAIAALAAMRGFGAYRASWLSWLNLLLGLWLVAAPWALNYVSDEARANSVIVGIIVAALALWSALTSEALRSTRRLD